MESIRDKLILLQYQLSFNNHQQRAIESFLSAFEPDMERYHARKNQIAALKQKRTDLQTQLDSLTGIHPIQSARLNQQINEVTEEIEDAISNRNMILTKLHCQDTKELETLEKKIKTAHNSQEAVLAKQPKLYEQFDQYIKDYHEASAQTLADSIPASDTMRSEHQAQVRAKLEKAYGDHFDPKLYEKSVDEVNDAIHEIHLHERERSGNDSHHLIKHRQQRQSDDAR